MAEPKPLMHVIPRTPSFEAWQLTARNAWQLCELVGGVLADTEAIHLAFTSDKTSFVMIEGDWLLRRPATRYHEGSFFSCNRQNFEQSYLEVEHGD